jgi:hypothetical protein
LRQLVIGKLRPCRFQGEGWKKKSRPEAGGNALDWTWSLSRQLDKLRPTKTSQLRCCSCNPRLIFLSIAITARTQCTAEEKRNNEVEVSEVKVSNALDKA